MQNPDAEEFADDVADCNIEFELASHNPNEQATDGITRTQTSEQSFKYIPFARTGPERNPVKFNQSGGTAAWPRNRYLNIWVCNLKGWDGRTLLGHASFPGGRAREDGVVVNYPYFGTTGTATPPYDGGRTVTHEVGHWLNLRHIWGDDEGCLNSDFVENTPNQAGPNYQCPIHPSITCSEGGDMFMNYMDYVYEDCMMMFTAGQAARMNATLRGPRARILRSNALEPPEESVEAAESVESEGE